MKLVFKSNLKNNECLRRLKEYISKEQSSSKTYWTAPGKPGAKKVYATFLNGEKFLLRNRDKDLVFIQNSYVINEYSPIFKGEFNEKPDGTRIEGNFIPQIKGILLNIFFLLIIGSFLLTFLPLITGSLENTSSRIIFGMLMLIIVAIATKLWLISQRKHKKFIVNFIEKTFEAHIEQ